MTTAMLKVGMFTCLISTVIYGAATNGRIEGVVTDATGAVVVSATVTIVNDATAVRQTVKTRSEGAYAFPVLPVGRYSLEVVYPDLRPYKRTSIVVDANSALVINVSLELMLRRPALKWAK
jgi:Carboxypeptidase regulatory-like domain